MKFDYFNLMHFLLILMLPAIFLVMFFLLRKKDKSVQIKVMFWVAVVNVIIMVLDKSSEAIVFTKLWVDVIPLHLCNVFMIMLPFAFYHSNAGNGIMYGILFFLAVPAGLAPIVLGNSRFVGHGLEYFSVLGYFITHSLQIVLALLPVVFGLYKPKIKDALLSSLALFLFAAFCHGVNAFLRASKLSMDANFMYTFYSDQNFVFELLYKFIPIPFLYLLPVFVIIVPVLVFEAWLFEIISKKSENKSNLFEKKSY